MPSAAHQFHDVKMLLPFGPYPTLTHLVETIVRAFTLRYPDILTTVADPIQFTAGGAGPGSGTMIIRLTDNGPSYVVGIQGNAVASVDEVRGRE